MKRYWLATVSSLALISAASAADLRPLPTKAPPPIAVAAWSWQGFYVGLTAGALRHRGQFDAADAVGNLATADIHATSAIFGGHLGFNWQIANWVVGMEGDLNWTDADASRSVIPVPGGPVGSYQTRLSGLATVRGRIGVTFSPTLLYFTGGYASARVENTAPGVLGGFPTRSDRLSGWTVGGGLEHMFAPNWTARVEGLYVNLSDTTQIGNLGYVARFSNTAVLGRVGVSLKW